MDVRELHHTCKTDCKTNKKVTGLKSALKTSVNACNLHIAGIYQIRIGTILQYATCSMIVKGFKKQVISALERNRIKREKRKKTHIFRQAAKFCTWYQTSIYGLKRCGKDVMMGQLSVFCPFFTMSVNVFILKVSSLHLTQYGNRCKSTKYLLCCVKLDFISSNDSVDCQCSK